MKPLIKFLQADPPQFADYIVVKRSKRAKRLALRLDTHKRVFNLVIPKGMSYRKAHQFALDNNEWMQDKLNELPEPIDLDDGAVVSIFGKKHIIKISYDETLKGTSVGLINNYIVVLTNKEDPTSRIIRFLRNEAQKKLEELSLEKAAMIRRRVKSVTVRDTKSRWGSCTEDGNISYSWRLIFAPYEALDYVVAHEVAHLRHLDHSQKFWNLCRELSDDFIEGRYWMHNHGHELMRYGA